MSVAPKKKPVCMICGKPSQKMICDPCSEQLQGEALHKKKKDKATK